MSDERDPLVNDSSRRDFLKKSLVAGAVVWSAPVVASLPGGRAWAAVYGTCNCNASAYGLFVNIPALGVNTTLPTSPNTCVIPLDTGASDVARVQANTICESESSSPICTASGTIESLDVTVGPALAPNLHVAATVLQATASADCAACGTDASATQGASTAATLTVSGTLIGGTINVNVATSCNLDVLGLGIVKVNEQVCDPNTGELTVNALHIRVPATGTPIIEVIAAHAQAGAVSTTQGIHCNCQACA